MINMLKDRWGAHLYEAILDVNLERCWIGRVMNEFPVSLKIVDTIPFRENGVQDLVEIDLGKADIEKGNIHGSLGEDSKCF